MKFGLQLQQEIFAPWRVSYIQYDVLKTELKNRQLGREWTEDDEQDFIKLLENELQKVYDFVTAKLIEVESRISYCERTLQTFMNNPDFSSDQSWNIMDEALTEVLFDVNDLAKFTRVNYIGFQKILKKHDKWTSYNLVQGFVPQLRAMPLDKQRFDVAIVFISALHDICRQRGRPRTGNAAAGGDQNAFERATAKYWIHPDNITEVKSIIMLHLPVLIFDKDKRYESSDSAISSVYFDNDDFDLYTGRLQRDEGAEAIRFRWYGPMTSKNVFIERKTHHAPWLNGASVKDRFRLSYDDVQPFVAGNLTADEYRRRIEEKGTTDPEAIEANHFIAKGVQTSFQEKQLKPKARIFYNRTAFQLPGDQRVRVSLDTDLTFIREDDLDGKKRCGENEWRRSDVGIDYPFSYLDESEVLRFPYAVLETKLQTHLGQEPPQWLTKLVDSHLVHEVTRFSKYLHAASCLFTDRIPLMPWWLTEMEEDIRRPRATDFGLTRSRSFKPLIDGQYRHAMEQEERRKGLVNTLARSGTLGRTSARGRPKRTNASTESADHPNQDQSTAAFSASNVSLNQPRPHSSQQPSFLSVNRSPSPPSETLHVPQSKEMANMALNASTVSFATSQNSSFWDQPHKDMSTLLLAGDPPNPSLIQNKASKKASNSPSKNGVLGEAVVVPVEKNQGDLPNGSQFEEVYDKGGQDKGWLKNKVRRFWPGATDNIMVADPNQSGRLIPVKKIKVEPKVFFANERTFISWLQFCALLLTVALSLLNFGDDVSRIAGGIFIGIAAVVAIYALYRFERRAWMINRRLVGRYDDLWGPAVLCVLLVGALIVNFYLRFR